MAVTDVLVALAIVVGLLGVVVPVLPGTLLILGAVLVWALEVSTAAGWVVLGVVAALLTVGGVVKYVVPGRRLQVSGVPRRTLVLGGVVGVLGFFVVPVIGLLIGFVLGVYLSEVQRVGPRMARPSTLAARRAVGRSVLIELAAGLLAALVWLVAAIAV